MDAFVIIAISILMFSAGWIFKTIQLFCKNDGYLQIVTDLKDKSRYTYLDLNTPFDILEEKEFAVFLIKRKNFK